MQLEPKTRCRTCLHPQRRDIEIEWLFDGKPRTKMAEDWKISYPSLKQHFDNHITEAHKQELYAYMRLKSAEKVVEADRVDVVETLKKLSAEAETFLQQAKNDGDVRAGVQVIKELRQQLELTARIFGDLGPQKPSTIFADHPEWQKVKAVLMRIFDKHPPAKAEFLKEMGYVALTDAKA